MKISSPVTCERLIRPKLQFINEELWCIALSAQCEHLGHVKLFEGTSNTVSLHYKKILNYSFITHAEQIILVHTHLGSYSFPSDADLYWTEKIKRLFELFEIKLSDHIIISKNDFTSLLQYDPQIFDH